MPKPFDVFVYEAPDALAVHWGWALALGVVIGVLGVLAILRATTATKIAVGFLGILLIVSAASILLFSLSVAGLWTEFFVQVLWGVLVGVVGVILLTRPMLSAEAITLVICFYFLISGLSTIGFAFTSHLEGMWVYLLQGGVSLFLGVLLLVGWPFTGDWAIGTFIGIDLLFKSGSIIALALGLRAISEGPLF
ncbi:DUF308 domain-containing protein [Methylocystis sp. IM3]|jgi:uncharacterized membrane protein HdeD (DUF308 family)|uniref:HdeD family acid-resistance protein n=1 Tax=unclassified Methylocystis TaxID=2625913 RepID=UPI000F947F82|nr:MAG: hypothetical protein EKK29_15105 [Hyphomicrobiales bacterium]